MRSQFDVHGLAKEIGRLWVSNPALAKELSHAAKQNLSPMRQGELFRLIPQATIYIGYCVYWSASIRPYPMISATFAYRHNGRAIWITADELHFFDMAVEMEKVKALEYRPSRSGNDFCLYLNDGQQLVYPADFWIGPLSPE